MTPSRKPLPEPVYTLVLLLLLACGYCCIVPTLDYAWSEVRLWLATPTPTPVALGLDLDPAAEVAAREAVYRWLREQRGWQGQPDPELEVQAYYLAGEAPRLRAGQTWPSWFGQRYVAGPAAGQWVKYWPGGTTCYGYPGWWVGVATCDLPGLAEAERAGAAVVWRAEEPYVALVWPGWCPPPTPEPTRSYVGPTGPGQ